MSLFMTFDEEPIFAALPPDDPKVRAAGRQLYRLTQNFPCRTERFGVITAPAGLLTDRASIPRLAFAWMAPDDPAILYPAVIHDALYETQGVIPDAPPLSREDADGLLRDLMLVCGARRTQAEVVYRAVRMFGGSRWTRSIDS